jgi:hypothetical protein
MGLPLWVWLFVMPLALGAICLFVGARLEAPLRRFWGVMDGLYFASGVVAS